MHVVKCPYFLNFASIQKSFQMNGSRKIKSALISVFYKDGLKDIVKTLDEQGVKIFSTGGTQTFIEELGIKVTAVEDLTSYPSILGGRVKTRSEERRVGKECRYRCVRFTGYSN